MVFIFSHVRWSLGIACSISAFATWITLIPGHLFSATSAKSVDVKTEPFRDYFRCYLSLYSSPNAIHCPFAMTGSKEMPSNNVMWCLNWLDGLSENTTTLSHLRTLASRYSRIVWLKEHTDCKLVMLEIIWHDYKWMYSISLPDAGGEECYLTVCPVSLPSTCAHWNHSTSPSYMPSSSQGATSTMPGQLLQVPFMDWSSSW